MKCKNCLTDFENKEASILTQWLLSRTSGPSVAGLETTYSGGNGFSTSYNSQRWLNLYLSACKFLDLALALPPESLPQFQMSVQINLLHSRLCMWWGWVKELRPYTFINSSIIQKLIQFSKFPNKVNTQRCIWIRDVPVHQKSLLPWLISLFGWFSRRLKKWKTKKFLLRKQVIL